MGINQEIRKRKQVEIELERLLEAEHEQRLLAETLAEVTLALTSQTSHAAVLNEVLRQVQRLVPYRTAHIMLLEGDNLRIACWQGYKSLGSEELISRLIQPLSDFPFDAEVVQSRQPLIIPDTYQEPRWVVQDETAWVRSHMVTPICLGDQVLGLLRLDAETPHAFSTKDLARLQPLANAAAIALGNARLYDQAQQEIAERKLAEENVRRRNRELALLNQIIAASAAGLEPAIILETTCRELAAVFDAPQVTATFLDEGKTTATVIAEYLDEGQWPSLNSTIAIVRNPLFQYLLRHKAPLAVSDAQHNPELAAIHDLLRQQGIASLFVLPLIIEDGVIGSLGLYFTELRTFSPEEISLAWSVADQVAGALARAQLHKERRQLSTAIEQSAESIIITDTKGVILYVNPAFQRITGYSRSEAVGRNINLLKSGQHEAGFYQELWAAISSGEVWHGRFTNKRKDGSFYTEEATISPVRSETGAIVNYVSVQRDVTRELELEEQYRQAQKMQAIGQLAGGIAHDFNNLLTAINGFAEAIQFELSPHDLQLQKFASNIRQAGNSAAALVRQLLAFSRKQVIELQVLNLNTIVTDTSKLLERLIEKNITLETILAPDLWPVKVDPAQFEQVIVNLAVNARDAMPAGGRLIIETSNIVLDEEYTAKHLELQPGEYVLLTMSDTGVGMSEQVKRRIFEPFFTTKEQGKGTGLGLAIVFGVVQQSGGRIWVYSEVNQGTTFKIYLPRTKETMAIPPQHQADDLPQGTETVLVVEDDLAVRGLAVHVLRRQGYNVLEAANGQEALQLSQAHAGEIHLLLTDTVMPQMGGKALVDRIRTSRPSTKILLTSGYTDKAIMNEGIPDPRIAFIPKPFSAKELARKVRAVLDS